jgi:hypothetical protein
MDVAERLRAIEDIKALKARYFRCMDNKDWPGLQAVFAPDVVCDFRDSTGTRDESLLSYGAEPYVKMEDLLWVQKGAPVPYKTMRGFGHYHETYEKRNGAWEIKTIRLSRLRVDLT